MEKLDIRIQEGAIAPRYTTEKKLHIKEAIITERGTVKGLPIVDLVLEDDEGNKHFTMITGRLVTGLSAAIRGVNMRIHGTQEP